MVDGMDLNTQELYFYNQGGTQRGIAIIHYQQRMGTYQDQPGVSYQQQAQQLSQQSTTQTQTVQPQSSVPALKPLTPLEQTLAKQNPQLTEALYQQRTKTPLSNFDLKTLLSGPAPAEGTYQAKPGGPLLIATEEQSAKQTAELTIKESPYKKLGYTPSDTGNKYQTEIQSLSDELKQEQMFRSQAQSASPTDTFTIGGKQYTKQEAIDYVDKSINQLTESKAKLERAQEAGYILNKTDTGYSFSLPKASDVVTSIYGAPRAISLVGAKGAQEFLGLGPALAEIGGLITGKPGFEEWKEEKSQEILGATRGKNESVEDYSKRFWTSPEAIVNVWLPIATVGIAEGVTTVGKVVVPQLLSASSKLAEFSQELKAGVSGLKEALPESVQYAGFRLGFAGQTAIYTAKTGAVVASEIMANPVASQGLKYGFYGIMEGPTLVQTAQQQPEMLLSRLGSSLAQYEVGMKEIEYGVGGLQRGIAEIRQPGFAQLPLGERVGISGIDNLGLRPLGEEAGQPLPGAKRLISTKGMTPEESFAFTYKEPPVRISPEEAEANALARSLEKKKPSGFREFIKSEEGMQPLPGIRPFTSEKRGFDALVKSDETAQPLPGVRPTEPGTVPRKEIFFSETTGKTEFIGGTTPRGMATSIEEFPRVGELQIGEAVKPGTRLEIPASYEQEVTQLGTGKNRLDLIEAKPGKATGNLIMEEPSKPGGIATFGLQDVIKTNPELGETGMKTVTPVSNYGLGKNEPSLMESGIIPETKEQAIKSQKAIYSSREIGKIPSTQEEAMARIQSYYGEPVKTNGTVALKIGKKTKLFTKEDIGDFTGLIKPEPAVKQGYYALDFKGEEEIFRTEIPGGEKPYEFKDIDIGKIGSAQKEIYAVNIKGNVKTFSGEDLLGLGKGELKARPQRFTEEQLQKAVYSPGGSAEYYGKQLRKTMRVKTDTGVPIGTRPEEGWRQFLGERQEAKIFIEKEKEYILPELEKPTKIISGGKTTPSDFTKTYTTEDFTKSLRYEPGPRPDNIFLRKELSPFSIEGEQIGKQTYTLEMEQPIEKTSFQPSGLYESPEMKYQTIERPLTKEEVQMLTETDVVSTRWETIRPKMEKGAHLLMGMQGAGLIDSVKETGGQLQFASGLEGKGFGSPLMDIQGLGLGELNKQALGNEQLPDLFRGSLSSQRYDPLLGQRQEQGTEQRQRQALLQRSAQLSEQATQQEEIQDTMRLQIGIPLTDTATDIGFNTGYSPGTDIFIPGLPPRKRTEELFPEKKETKTTEDTAYDVYVKERSMYHGKIRKGFRFAKANRQPLTEQDAMSLGGDITDNTSAVSFRLKKVKGTPTRLDRPLQEFRTRSYKFTKKGETYIEKPEYRMDTPGELQQVSALGQQERRQPTQNLIGTNTFNMRTTRRRRKQDSGLIQVETPKNKTTRSLSTKTILKDINIFKRKKGGRKNDFY